MEMKTRITKISGKGFSCNVYVLQSGESNLIIDPGCDAKHLLSHLLELGIRPARVAIVINTHCHVDHASCNGLFENAKIMLHAKDAVHIEGKHKTHILAPIFPKTFTNRVDRELADGERIRFGNAEDEDELLVIHTPGHTLGSICLLHTPSRTLFSGDTIFANGAVGRCDLPGGNSRTLSESIERLGRDFDFGTIHPGHGDSTSRKTEFV